MYKQKINVVELQNFSSLPFSLKFEMPDLNISENLVNSCYTFCFAAQRRMTTSMIHSRLNVPNLKF